MNKIVFTITTLLAAGCLFTACHEDFLEPDPLSFYEPGKTFTTIEGLESVLATADRHLRTYWTYYTGQDIATPIYSQYMYSDLNVAGKTDQSTIFADIATRLTPTDGLEQGEINMLSYFWGETFTGIKSANTVISYIDRVEGLDEETKNIYLGRAYFHRAFRYLSLVFMFKDVPYIAKIIDSPKLDYRSTSRKAILEKMALDMEFAVKWVPDQKDMDLIGMVNKGACRMLLAKLYLSLGRWDDAIAQCDALIDDPQYSLMTSEFGTFIEPFNTTTFPVTRNVIWDLHRPENKLIPTNKEVILGMPNRGIGSSNSFIYFNTMRALVPLWNSANLNAPDGKRAIQAYARTNSNFDPMYAYNQAVGRGTGYIRPTWFAQHSLWNVNGVPDEGDLRHSVEMGNWCHTELLKVNNKESIYFGEPIQKAWTTDTIRDWYGWPHYKIYLLDQNAESKENSTNWNGANSSSSTAGNADWYCYRLAETYLLRAEAKFYKGDATGAAQDVNTIRRRAHCQQMYTTVTIGDIVNERARELYMEEWRYMELSRISYCLAISGQPDEWGNTYNPETYDKQSGTDKQGGSYWWQRIVHYNDFYNKNPQLLVKNRAYTLDKHNLYLPIPQSAIDANRNAQLRQNYGYDGYDESIPMWETWEESEANN